MGFNSGFKGLITKCTIRVRVYYIWGSLQLIIFSVPFSNYGLWLARLFGIKFPSSKIEARAAFCVREHLKYEADLTFKRTRETAAVFFTEIECTKSERRTYFLYHFYFQKTKANAIE